MAEPMLNENTRARFNYADDIGILGIGRIVAKLAAATQREVDVITNWAHRNAVKFNTKKSKVAHFPARTREDHVGIQINNTYIDPADHN